MLALEPPPLSGYLHEQPEVLSLPADHGSVHCRPSKGNLKSFNKTMLPYLTGLNLTNRKS